MIRILFLILLFFLGMTVAVKNTDREPHTHSNSSDERFGKKGEHQTDQPDKFLQYHRGIRTRSDQRGPAYSSAYKWIELRNARLHQQARLRNGRAKSNGVVNWKERGPANVPGRIRALYNIPSDASNNSWLAGAATGGIWRTTDGGTSWSERSADFPVLPISSFASDNSGSAIYAGTGEFVSSVFSALGNGIFKSTDNGVTWSQLSSTANNSDFAVVTRLIVHPTNSNTILATTVPHDLTIGKTSVMRSTDGGNSWAKVLEADGAFEQIIATPGNFATQFVTQKGEGIWKSQDAGLTWTKLDAAIQPTGRIELSISPVNPQKIFASCEGTLSDTESDLYMSPDGGITWSLIEVKFANKSVDFLEGQGFYDNTILAHPFSENEVYFGGVSLFKSTIGAQSTNLSFFAIHENDTDFIFLQTFSNATEDEGRLSLGTAHNNTKVEIRFGPGKSQKAHRFEVPVGASSGVAVADYSYKSYDAVPFEVWDVSANRQLMVSFRDQNVNGVFDLVPPNLSGTSNQQSREYLYIHNITYNTSPAPSVAINGGHEASLMYNLYPALATGKTWNAASLPVSKLVVKQNVIQKFSATTVTVADGRGDFDKKNTVDQINLELGVHPDHHFMVPLITSQAAKTFRLLIANDGGVFVSKSSATPGTTQGDWLFKGFGLNTSQFYGADKKPGAQQYIGGMQDNGTRLSAPNQQSSASTLYSYGLSGDGFEVLWHSKNPKLLLGSTYYSQISKSSNGGQTWESSVNGFTPAQTEFPFVTKLANSKDFPDRVFTVGASGVYRSENFGSSWQLVPIAQKFVIGTPFFLDVEVSRANANIVWAGSGMNNEPANQRSLHVSTDGGKTFSSTNNFTQTALGNITKLASHPTEPNTAYAIFSFAKSPKILRTTNLGQSWEDITGFGAGSQSTNGFPDVAVFCVYVRPDNPNIIWAGTEIGIVQSLDNGMSWSLIDEFINVSVWDMRGQDNEIVIATHGRGIWTAEVPAVQEALTSPIILAAGTSPDKSFAVRIKTEFGYDSLVLFSNSNRLKRLPESNAGTYELTLSNVSPGAKILHVVGYQNQAPHQSMVYEVTHFDLLAKKNSYSTYFTSVTDLALKNLTHQTFAGASSSQRKTLHTSHSYSPNTEHEVFIRTPVTVSSSVPSLYYSDIAVIEPEHDFVVVEATKNGLDWLPLAEKYDASFSGDQDGKWLTAYLSKTSATAPMFLHHEININETFTAGDVLLFRLRMISNAENTAWGWALNYITIQEVPVGIALETTPTKLSVYPNPTVGNFNVSFYQTKESDLSIEVIDVYGRKHWSSTLYGVKQGEHSVAIELTSRPSNGTYFLVLMRGNQKEVMKLSITR